MAIEATPEEPAAAAEEPAASLPKSRKSPRRRRACGEPAADAHGAAEARARGERR